MRVSQQGVDILEGAELRVHAQVVGHVVAVVVLRRGVERADPDGVHAELAQVAQPGAHSLQVADAVAVGVLEAAHVHLVGDGVTPPP